MVLGDGERERVLEDPPGFCPVGGLTGAEEQFAEQDAGHHPVAARSRTGAVVLRGFGQTAFGIKRLREAETEKRVGRLGGHKGGEPVDAVGHGADGGV